MFIRVHFSMFFSDKPSNTKLSVDVLNTSAVVIGSSVVFNCTTDSHPAPQEYRFLHNEQLLGSNTSGIYHLQISNSGVYRCVPINKAGEGESAVLNITVFGECFP